MIIRVLTLLKYEYLELLCRNDARKQSRTSLFIICHLINLLLINYNRPIKLNKMIQKSVRNTYKPPVINRIKGFQRVIVIISYFNYA